MQIVLLTAALTFVAVVTLSAIPHKPGYDNFYTESPLQTDLGYDYSYDIAQSDPCLKSVRQ